MVVPAGQNVSVFYTTARVLIFIYITSKSKHINKTRVISVFKRSWIKVEYM